MPNGKYSPEEIETLYQEFSKGTDLLEMEKVLGRPYHGIACKLDFLSRLDSNKWYPEKASDYKTQASKIYYSRNKHNRLAYYQTHRDRLLADQKEYYMTHKDEMKKRAHLWQKQNPEKVAQYRKNLKRKKTHVVFGEWLDKKLSELKKNQNWLAKELGVAKQTVSSYKSGLYAPRSNLREKMAGLLEVDTDAINELILHKGLGQYPVGS